MAANEAQIKETITTVRSTNLNLKFYSECSKQFRTRFFRAFETPKQLSDLLRKNSSTSVLQGVILNFSE